MKLTQFKHVANSNSTKMLIALLLGLFFAVQLTTRHVNPGKEDRVTDVTDIEQVNESQPISLSSGALGHE